MKDSTHRITDSRSPHQPFGERMVKKLSRLAYSHTNHTPKPWIAYSLAILGTALATALRWGLGTLVGPSLSTHLTYYPVVMLAALVGGAGPGLFATVLSAVAEMIFFLPPFGLAVSSSVDQLGLVIFSCINIAVTFICAALRSARNQIVIETHRARASEIRYRRLFETTHDGVLLLNADSHKITDANPFITQFLGYSREELLGKELWEIGLIGDAEASRAAFDQLAREGRIRYENLPLQAKIGQTREVEFISNVYDEDGSSVIQCNIRDITLRKQAESERTALRDKLAADLSAMNGLHDLTTRFLGQQAPESLLQATLDTAIAITGASKGNVQLFDPASRELGVAVQRGFNEQFVEYFSHIHPGQVACGTALQTRQCVIVEDIAVNPLFTADPEALRLKLAAGVRAIACTPLIARTSYIVGVLSIHFTHPHRPSDRDLRFLDLLARQAADFIERKQAEANLQETQQRLRRALDYDYAVMSNMGEGLYALDTQGFVTYVNPTAERLLGWSSAELLGKKMHEVVRYKHPDGRPFPAEECAGLRVLHSGTTLTDHEDMLIRKDGTFFPVVCSFSPIRSGGTLLGLVVVFRDVTAQRRTEAALQRQAKLIDLSPTATIVHSLEGQIIFWSAGAQTLYGWTSSEAIGRIIHDLLQTQFPSSLANIIAEIQRDSHWSGELRHRARDGRKIIVQSHWLGQFASDGSILELLESNTDITASKQASEALRQSEERFRLIADAVPLMIWQCQPDRSCDYFNKGWLDFTGRPIAQELGSGWTESLHPDDKDRYLTVFSASFDRREPFEIEYRVRHRSGLYRWVVARGRPRFAADGTFLGYIGGCNDIQDRKQAELDLACVRDQLVAELDAMKRLHDLGTRFLQQEDLHALLEDLIETGVTGIGAQMGHVHLLDRATGELPVAAQRGLNENFLDYFSHIKPGQIACGTAIQTSQTVVVEDVTQSPLFLGDGKAMELKLANRIRAMVCTPLVAFAGQVVGVLSIDFHQPHRPSDRDLRFLDLLARMAADFIERKQAETALREAHDKLATANAELDQKVRERTAKLRETIAELEGFSYSLVHDMRAPLRAMVSYAGIVELEAGQRLDPEYADMLRKIKLAAVRMDQLVTDSLNYSRIVREDLPLGPVNLVSLLRGMTDTYPNLHPPQADISIEIDDLIVHGNLAALTQVFSNLLGNAVKFVAPGVHPHVRVWAQSKSTEVLVWVEDNGIGIPKDQQEKIFGMFQRAQRSDDYPGTGIGLALVRKSLDRTGGQVCLDSEPGKGSRFCVLLPLFQQEHQSIVE